MRDLRPHDIAQIDQNISGLLDMIFDLASEYDSCKDTTEAVQEFYDDLVIMMNRWLSADKDEAPSASSKISTVLSSFAVLGIKYRREWRK